MGIRLATDNCYLVEKPIEQFPIWPLLDPIEESQPDLSFPESIIFKELSRDKIALNSQLTLNLLRINRSVVGSALFDE